MGTLTPTEILGMYVFFGIQFMPIAALFLLALVRYSIRVSKQRKAAQIRHVPLSDHTGLDYVGSQSTRFDYDTCHRNNPIVLPFGLYVTWLFVNAGIETAATFLVWFDNTPYHNWVYQTYLAVMFVLLFVKLFWVITLFDSGFYKGAAISSCILFVLVTFNTIIVVQAAPGRAQNWVLNMLSTIFYFYTFLVMIHFYHMSERGRAARHRECGIEKFDLIGLLYPRRSNAYHGSHVDPSNVASERRSGPPR